MGISIVPHHLMNFYLHYYLWGDFFDRLIPHYGIAYAENAKSLCRLLFSGDVEVEVKLYIPDSICFPQGSRKCEKCLEKVIEGRVDELYVLSKRVGEMENLLYFNLKPGEFSSREIVDAIRKASKKLRKIVPKEISNIEVYLVRSPDSSLRDFPEVVKFRNSRIYGELAHLSLKLLGDGELRDLRARYSDLLKKDDIRLFETVLNGL